TIAGNLTNSSAVNVTGGSLKLASDGSFQRVIKVPSVSVTGGNIDLQDNKMIVVGGAAGSSWNGTAYAGVAGLVQSGYAGGFQSGVGIVTTQSNAIKPSVLTQLVTMSATDANKTTFANQSVSGGDQLIMYTWGGDANMDGTL